VFAKDRETALLIECTQCETPKKKSMATLIEKIESLKGKIANSIKDHYGVTPKLKIRWVVATRNIEWPEVDLKKAELAKIIVLRDAEIEYYNRLSDHLKKGAKYQFLSHVFSNEEISGLQDIKVPATRGTMGGDKYYTFLIKPSDLLKIAYISHKASRNVEDLDTYQRMLNPKRLKSIAKYIDNGGQFPTNIVVNIKDSKGLLFQPGDIKGDSPLGMLRLPPRYATAWIIDGQHRLYGYAHSQRAVKQDDKTTFPVLAYERLSPSKEAQLFVDINYQQVRVPNNLLIELYSNLKWDSEDPKERLSALRSRIILSLDQRKTSPIHSRLKTEGTKKSNIRCLTITNLNDGLQENKLLGEIKGAAFKHGVLYDSSSADPLKTLNKAIDLLSGYFSFFAEALPEHWDSGDARQGYLCSNLGMRALLKVFKEICNHIWRKEEIELDMCDATTILGYIKPYTVPIIEYFTIALPDNLKKFKDSSKAGVTRSSMDMMYYINEKFPDFCPKELNSYLDSIDKEGTTDARDKLDEIGRCLFEMTMTLLRNKHGDNWWFDGIPGKIQNDCLIRCNEDRGMKEKEQYIFFIDYYAIAFHDWDLFQEYYSFSKDGGKEKQLKWIKDLNKIRQTTHHPEKWPALKEQVATVREYYTKVMGRYKMLKEKFDQKTSLAVHS
jgi:DGQHR domain-containing protein